MQPIRVRRIPPAGFRVSYSERELRANVRAARRERDDQRARQAPDSQSVCGPSGESQMVDAALSKFAETIGIALGRTAARGPVVDRSLRDYNDVVRIYRERTGEEISPASARDAVINAIRKIRKAIAGIEP